MNIFDDVRFTKKLNSIFDLLSRTKVYEMPRIIFTDDEGFTHKLEFLWFRIQNNYWVGHVASRRNSIYVVENWTFDGDSRNVIHHDPAFPIIKKADKRIENVSFNVDDLLNKIDLLMVEML